MQTQRRRIVAAALAGPLAALAGCAGLFGPPTVRLSESELHRLAQRAFPVQRRVLEVMDTTVANPRLRLLPDTNRIGALLDIGARDRLFGGVWQGQLDFDAGLRWEPADQSVRLAQVKVLDLRLATSGNAARSPGERLGAALAERVLEDFTLYRLSNERAAELQRQGLVPQAVTVTARGVEITFTGAAR